MALRVDVEADLGMALLRSPMRCLLRTTLAFVIPWCLPARTRAVYEISLFFLFFCLFVLFVCKFMLRIYAEKKS